MKSEDVPESKFREAMVPKWQNLEMESGNPLAQQYIVPVGRGANIVSAVV
jgi:hypothetical protein